MEVPFHFQGDDISGMHKSDGLVMDFERLGIIFSQNWDRTRLFIGLTFYFLHRQDLLPSQLCGNHSQ